MGMMEGDNTELPATINPDLSSKERAAAVAQEDYYKFCHELQQLAASGWVDM